MTEGEVIGKWFHSYNKDGTIKWQGQVIDRDSKWHIVQLYSFVDGSEVKKEKVSLMSMLDWDFYETSYNMREAFYRHHRIARGHFESDEEQRENMLKIMYEGAPKKNGKS